MCGWCLNIIFENNRDHVKIVLLVKNQNHVLDQKGADNSFLSEFKMLLKFSTVEYISTIIIMLHL